MSAAWATLPFDELIADVSAGNIKTAQSEIKSSGRFPVIDQGKDLVAGFVDEESRLCNVALPAIVFGDHTRCFKYIDFPFCMGADGVKVLRPRVEADVKFLYHALRQVRLPDGGYDRHFKYLKRERLPLPPLPEQRRIAAILDQAEALRMRRSMAIRMIDDCCRSLFFELFGDPVTNPKRWPEDVVLGDIAEIASGITKGRKLNGSSTRLIPFMAVVNVQDRHLDLSVIKEIEATDTEIERYRLRKGDLLLTEGGDPDKLGRGTLWNDEIKECIHQNHVFRVRLNTNRLTPLYLNWLVGSERGKKYFLRSAKQTTGIASINMTQLRSFPLVVPPVELQRAFENAIGKIESIRSSALEHQERLNQLFSSLQHRAFRGEL
ncbi:MAG TPA: restriction endonuclease subunit S [Steroidobacteraceae bacterium]|nr:restriction endonuclease subunit S [Steroidobacteraceae bacterium]